MCSKKNLIPNITKAKIGDLKKFQKIWGSEYFRQNRKKYALVFLHFLFFKLTKVSQLKCFSQLYFGHIQQNLLDELL